MKNLWVGTTAGLNRKWAELRAGQPGVWVVKSFAGKATAQKPAHVIESNLQFYCLRLLRDAFGEIGNLFEGSSIDAIIRAALRDGRCAQLPEFQNLLARPGMVKVLSEKLKRTAAPEYADEESLPWFADKSLERLRLVYQEKLAQAQGLDTPGLFLQFIQKSQTPELQQAIQKWHESLANKLGPGYALIVPRADQFVETTELLERSALSILMDGFSKVDLGVNLYPDDIEIIERFTTPWINLGLELQAILPPEDVPESHFLPEFVTSTCPTDQLGFIKAKEPRIEIGHVVDHVQKLLEAGFSPEAIAIHTPQSGTYLDQLRDHLAAAGVPITATAPPLIEEPLVRTILDVASAMIHDWPVESVADLLRHPDFRGDAIAGATSTNELARLAQDCERLGNVNGLETISKLLPARHELQQRKRGQDPETAYTIYSGSLFRNLADIVKKPAADLNWAASVAYFREIIQQIFGPVVMDHPRLRAYWELLDNKIGAALPGDESPWPWPDFHREAHLRAEQARYSEPQAEDAPATPKIQLTTGSETVPCVDHLILAGMTEGHFPSRSRIRRKLKQLQGHDLSGLRTLRSEELRIFRQLVGSANQTIWLSHHSRDERGIETKPSDFLHQEKWQPAPDIIRPSLPGLAESDHLKHLLQVQNARLQGISGPYTGEITQGHTREMLLDKFSADYIFSPTSLESASLCPFQFFSTYVLGLADEDAENDLETDFSAEGTAIHAILEELHQLQDNPQLLLSDVGDFVKKIKDLIHLKHPCPEDLAESALGRARWQVEHRRIEQRLAAYHEQTERDLQPPVKNSKGNGKINANTEFQGQLNVIGREVRAGGRKHRLQPLVLTEDQTGQRFQVGGRIDRIDGQAEADRARVRLLDYKTGGQITEKEVARKLHLQLPIYALMVHEKELAGQQMDVVDIGFWYLKKSKGGYRSIRYWLFKDQPLDIRSLADDYRPHLQMLVGRIRNGYFLVKPQEFACLDKCPYGEVCRIREQRSARDHRSSAANPTVINIIPEGV